MSINYIEEVVQQYKQSCDTCKSGWGVQLDAEVFRRIITEVWNEAIKECEGKFRKRMYEVCETNAWLYDDEHEDLVLYLADIPPAIELALLPRANITSDK